MHTLFVDILNSKHTFSNYYTTYPEPCQHICGRSTNNKCMNNQCIVDVDEECKLLFSAQVNQINSFQFCSGSNILLEFTACTDALIVNSL